MLASALPPPRRPLPCAPPRPPSPRRRPPPSSPSFCFSAGPCAPAEGWRVTAAGAPATPRGGRTRLLQNSVRAVKLGHLLRRQLRGGATQRAREQGCARGGASAVGRGGRAEGRDGRARPRRVRAGRCAPRCSLSACRPWREAGTCPRLLLLLSPRRRRRRPPSCAAASACLRWAAAARRDACERAAHACRKRGASCRARGARTALHRHPHRPRRLVLLVQLRGQRRRSTLESRERGVLANERAGAASEPHWGEG